jgi:hypothetical protein
MINAPLRLPRADSSRNAAPHLTGARQGPLLRDQESGDGRQTMGRALTPKVAVFVGSAAACIAPAALAQSLNDAVNAALSNNCSALVGSTPRFTDTWRADSVLDVVDITNGQTGVTTQDVPAPVTVVDGSGRTFIVRRSNPSNLDPAVAPTLTEAQILQIFQTSGVQFLQLSRFPAGNFGPGLSGLCQNVLARTNTNGNSTTANGVSGGSSTASGRSVSSLSSARDQSDDRKKRKKRKKSDQRNSDSRRILLASAEDGLGVYADAAGAGPFGVETFIDLRGGYANIDRDTTALEGGFDGDAAFVTGSVAGEFSDAFGLAGSVGWRRTSGEFNANNPGGGANEFSERMLTGALYGLASIPIGGGLALDLSAGGFYGRGKGEIQRSFTSTRASTFRLDVHLPGNPGAFGGTITVDTLTPVTDALDGDYKSHLYGFSGAASITFDAGGFSITPGVEFTRYKTRQSDYSETVTDARNDGLALRFDAFEDTWSETRLGGAIERRFGRLGLEVYGDLVLTGGAATPRRTATFVDDLRTSPFVIGYDVDDLDKTYGRFGLVAAYGVTDTMDVYVGAETLAGHDYLQSRALFVGFRLRP